MAGPRAMMHPVITCRSCQQPIAAHWELFQHATCQVPAEPLGPVARKLRPDLTRNITTHSSFPFRVWPWQFMTKIPQNGTVIRPKTRRKCRFLRFCEIHRKMEADDGVAKISFLAMR
jgi:hypothetical protein